MCYISSRLIYYLASEIYSYTAHSWISPGFPSIRKDLILAVRVSITGAIVELLTRGRTTPSWSLAVIANKSMASYQSVERYQFQKQIATLLRCCCYARVTSGHTRARKLAIERACTRSNRQRSVARALGLATREQQREGNE